MSYFKLQTSSGDLSMCMVNIDDEERKKGLWKALDIVIGKIDGMKSSGVDIAKYTIERYQRYLQLFYAGSCDCIFVAKPYLRFACFYVNSVWHCYEISVAYGMDNGRYCSEFPRGKLLFKIPGQKLIEESEIPFDNR